MNNSELRVVKFHGDDLITFERAGSRYVAMRRIVENMGMDWATQSVKIGQQTGKFNCCHIPTIGADGKTRQMLAMPLEKLQLWLATINPNKIKVPETRAKVERYQEESAIALHDYWTKGVAVRSDMDGIIDGMTPEVAKKIGGIVKGIVHKEIGEALASFRSYVTETTQGGMRRNGKTAGQIWRAKGFPPMKGVAAWFGNRLETFGCRAPGNACAEAGLVKYRLFDPDKADYWIEQGGGSAVIQQKIAERKGQGHLRLVGGKGAK